MITYRKQKGARIKKRFMWMECNNSKVYWNLDLKTWTLEREHGKYDLSSSLRCNSIKAFKRRLKKAPKGVKI
jgi:hypothetical protein